jgi:hypothetical protein
VIFKPTANGTRSAALQMKLIRASTHPTLERR